MGMLKITRSTLKTIENNLQRINLFFCELFLKNQDKKALLFTRYFMKTLVLLLTSFFSLSVAMANQDINTQKLELQKKFISDINQCSNPQQLDRFIQNALKNISNHEERARHAALVEELIKYNPSCFVASIKKLDSKSCEKIEESYLSEPFFYPREDLKASLATAKDFKASCLAS
jgi:hypothetical protein